MKRRDIFKGAALGLSIAVAGPALAQDTKVIGVAIPSATHGFMGGLNYHAQASIERLEATYPELDFVLATAGDAGKMVNVEELDPKPFINLLNEMGLPTRIKDEQGDRALSF